MILVILAAGMATRYGSAKQSESFGPNGETLTDYSIMFAIKIGFKKIVLVVRESTLEIFEEKYRTQYSGKIEIQCVTQEIDKIPTGYSYNLEREKPWGTGHATLMAKNCVDDDFVVINADDFYGYEAFEVIGKYRPLANEFAMVGYQLYSTLSDYGTVSRGVCEVSKDGYLIDINEVTNISKENNFPKNTIVSLNFWYFRKEHFNILEEEFKKFLTNRSQEPTSEFYIPTLAKVLLEKGEKCKVLSSDVQWFGVTYKEDAENVRKKLSNL
ncbi:MAG: nucleotidyltransferase [Bacteroidales bacterium]|nr:nucleotidyltransferase [Bacteroidales bacterium]